MEDGESISLPETPRKDVTTEFPITPLRIEEPEITTDPIPFKRGRKTSEKREPEIFSGSPVKKFRLDFTDTPIRKFPSVSLSVQYTLATLMKKGTKEEALEYLREQQNCGDKELAAEWVKVEEMFTEHLWHEFSLKMLFLAQHSSMQDQNAQINLYQNLTRYFDFKIDPLLAIAITEPLINSIADKKAVLDFLCYLMMRYRDHEEVAAVIELLQGETCLYHLHDAEGAKVAIGELKKIKLPTSKFLDISGRFYELAKRYHRLMRDYNQSYTYGMLSLLYTMKKMPRDRWHKEAFHLVIAALLADNVFDFVPLLEHPIMESLKTLEYKWLFDLLHACNAGDVSRYLCMEEAWKRIPLLDEYKAEIRYKVAVNGLREMIFNSPSSCKIFSIGDIVEKTMYNEDQAERFILKAFANNMVKGTIDGSSGKVNITWVKPRTKAVQNVNELDIKARERMAVISAMRLFMETEFSDFYISH